MKHLRQQLAEAKIPYCTNCVATNDLMIVSRSHGYDHYVCRSCNTERLREYRKTPAGKMAVRKSRLAGEAKHPERKAIYKEVRAKVEKKPCVICGVTKVDAHHSDYSKPLEVVHLCRLHHKQIHMGIIGIDNCK